METSSFNTPINLFEKEKWLKAVTSFEATNSVFNITDKNNSFSFTTPSYCSTRGGAGTMNREHKLLELSSQNVLNYK